MMNDRWLRIFISFFALVLIGIHVARPEVKIDSITVVLLIVSAVPWLQPLIKTVELPGGFKIELQELIKQVNTVKREVASVSQRTDFAVALGSSQPQVSGSISDYSRMSPSMYWRENTRSLDQS